MGSVHCMHTTYTLQSCTLTDQNFVPLANDTVVQLAGLVTVGPRWGTLSWRLKTALGHDYSTTLIANYTVTAENSLSIEPLLYWIDTDKGTAFTAESVSGVRSPPRFPIPLGLPLDITLQAFGHIRVEMTDAGYLKVYSSLPGSGPSSYCFWKND